jgi:hypothetical protein
MPDKVTFLSAQLLSFKRKPNGGSAQFSCSLSQPMCRAMGWIADIPAFVAKVERLDGDLAAHALYLVPKDRALERHAIELEITKVHKFKSVRLELEGSRGKGHRTEIRFQVDFADVKGARKLEEYILTCGKSTATVTYTRQAVQETLESPAGDEPLLGDEDDDEALGASGGIQ